MVDYTVFHRFINDIALIVVKGGCDSNCTGELETLLDHLIAEGYKRYILDVAGLCFAESPGFRLLISKVAYIQELGGNLIVVGLSGRVERAFSLLKLGGLVPTAEDVRSAIAELDRSHSPNVATGTYG